MKERTKLLLLLAAFGGAYFLPIEEPRTQRAFLEGLFLVKDYARQHVLLCLVPAFFIAGAIGQFVSQGAVMRYLGSRAPRPVAYGVASVSGSILAVCSCTVLPLFAGIYKRGAGLGPATAFLYSGPAINVLAMILTTRVLGVQLGTARTVGAVGFAIVVGVLMALEARIRRSGILVITVVRSTGTEYTNLSPAPLPGKRVREPPEPGRGRDPLGQEQHFERTTHSVGVDELHRLESAAHAFRVAPGGLVTGVEAFQQPERDEETILRRATENRHAPLPGAVFEVP